MGELFSEIDVDRTGTISLIEITKALANARIKAFFTHLNIDMASNGSDFFAHMDLDHNGVVTQEEFISGCLRFRGSAKPLEVAGLLLEMKSLSKKLETLYFKQIPTPPP